MNCSECVFFLDFHAIRITEVTIPKWIQNGTEKRAVLDCSYEAAPDESNVTVKWFFRKFRGNLENSKVEQLVYEWVPMYNFRYVNSALQGHFDWDYVLNGMYNESSEGGLELSNVRSGTDGQEFRALPVKRPNLDHSGVYTCQVTSNRGRDSKSQKLLVFGE